MAATVDATSNQQQNHVNNAETLPAESDHQSVDSVPEYNETVSEDSVSDQASQIYKGNSYEDVLAEVAETFPAATYALFDMTADGNPELIVKLVHLSPVQDMIFTASKTTIPCILDRWRAHIPNFTPFHPTTLS